MRLMSVNINNIYIIRSLLIALLTFQRVSTISILWAFVHVNIWNPMNIFQIVDTFQSGQSGKMYCVANIENVPIYQT